MKPLKTLTFLVGLIVLTQSANAQESNSQFSCDLIETSDARLQPEHKLLLTLEPEGNGRIAYQVSNEDQTVVQTIRSVKQTDKGLLFYGKYQDPKFYINQNETGLSLEIVTTNGTSRYGIFQSTDIYQCASL